ncbi:MAG: hypothetical protein IJ761_01700 [Bacteroidales bacterium]|nr:hypothetical protein [Bacteroidales bacterium]
MNDLSVQDGEKIDTIAFAYPNRDRAHARDSFCEAFTIPDTAICLFTKQWQSQQCACYMIPKEPSR